jgi:hypothetical protein
MAFAVALLIAGALLIAWGVTAYRGTRQQPASLVAPPPPASLPATSIDLVQLATSALQECPESSAPAIPDGAKTSPAQMSAAHAAFQAYDTATNNYTKCIDAAVERIAAQYKDRASAADMQALEAFGAKAHNTAIDQEQAVADQFNTQVRAFKAKHH